MPKNVTRYVSGVNSHNAATPVTQGMHLRYVWSGKKQRITDVLEVRLAGWRASLM